MGLVRCLAQGYLSPPPTTRTPSMFCPRRGLNRESFWTAFGKKKRRFRLWILARLHLMPSVNYRHAHARWNLITPLRLLTGSWITSSVRVTLLDRGPTRKRPDRQHGEDNDEVMMSSAVHSHGSLTTPRCDQWHSATLSCVFFNKVTKIIFPVRERRPIGSL